MEIEWDSAKADANERKHGIGFELASRALFDEHRIERLDERLDYGEDRFVTVGLVDGVALTVVYTVRGESLRIISARKADRREQSDYWTDH